MLMMDDADLEHLSKAEKDRFIALVDRLQSESTRLSQGGSLYRAG